MIRSPRSRLALVAIIAVVISALVQPIAHAETAIEPGLCIASECGTRTPLARVPEAENLVFTDDGRLFVSGDTLYEIVQDAVGEFTSVPVAMDGPHSASMGGLAVHNGILYLNDETERGLWAAPIGPDMTMRKIHTWTGYGIPNGLAVGPDGALYSTSGPLPNLANLGSVFRARLDPNDPLRVVAEDTIFGVGELNAANGLVADGDTMYVVGYGSTLFQKNAGSSLLGTSSALSLLETNAVFSFHIDADGTVGPLRQVAGRLLSAFDDIEVTGDRLLVATSFEQSVLMYDRSGRLLANSGPIFSTPTAVTVGRAPMFSPDDVIVTERGIMGDATSDVGNVISAFRRTPVAS